MIDWVVFDLGDVLLLRTQAMPQLAGLLAVDQDRFAGAYWQHRAGYDRTSDATEFWTVIAAESGGRAPDAELIAELVRIDDLGWSSINPETRQLAGDLRVGGIRLAVLSNAPSSMGRLIEASPTATVFEHLLFSGDLGLLKPEPAIYRTLLDRLDAAPMDVLFLDDRQVNVEGAMDLDIPGIVFASAEQARLGMRALGLPV